MSNTFMKGQVVFMMHDLTHQYPMTIRNIVGDKATIVDDEYGNAHVCNLTDIDPLSTAEQRRLTIALEQVWKEIKDHNNAQSNDDAINASLDADLIYMHATRPMDALAVWKKVIAQLGRDGAYNYISGRAQLL